MRPSTAALCPPTGARAQLHSRCSDSSTLRKSHSVSFHHPPHHPHPPPPSHPTPPLGRWDPPNPNAPPTRLDRESIRTALDASLRRMQTDYVDLCVGVWLVDG